MRPVTTERFLIGSATCCDLRLGGPGMPPLHSILLITDDGILIDSVGSAPPLLVNGRKQRTCELQAGDEIQIGGVNLILHRTGVSESIIGVQTPTDDAIRQPTQAVRLAQVETELDIEQFSGAPTPDSLGELSASELLDLIEAEEALIDEFESRRQLGAAALLRAISERSSDPESSRTDSSQTVLQELQSAIVSLNRYSQELGHQSQHLSRFELERARLRLLDFQQQIAGRLDDVLEKISELETDDDRFEGKSRRVA